MSKSRFLSRKFATAATLGAWLPLTVVSACADDAGNETTATTPSDTVAPPASTPSATGPGTPSSQPTVAPMPTEPTATMNPSGPTAGGPSLPPDPSGTPEPTAPSGGSGPVGSGGMGGTGGMGGMGPSGDAGGAGAPMGGSSGMGGASGAAGSGGMGGSGGSAGSGGMNGTPGEFSLTGPWSAGEECAPPDAKDACDDVPVENRATMIGGNNVMPTITWTEGPEGTLSFAIVYQDLSNGFSHWAMWNIPPDVFSVGPDDIPEGAEQAGLTGPSWFGSGSCTNVYQLSVHALSEATFDPGANMAQTAARDQLDGDDGTLVLATDFARVTPREPCGN